MSALKDLAKAKGISIAELARKACLPYSSVANFAAGTQKMYPDGLAKIAEVLEVDVAELSSLEEQIRVTLGAGPAGAAQKLPDQELQERILEHAEKLKGDPEYMRRYHCEVIAAFALELVRRESKRIHRFTAGQTQSQERIENPAKPHDHGKTAREFQKRASQSQKQAAQSQKQ